MNYFPFDPDPYESARALDDKRVRRCFQEAVMCLAELQRPTHPSPFYPKPMPMPPKLMAWLADPQAASWLYEWTHSLLVVIIERFGCGVQTWRSYDAWQALEPIPRLDHTGLEFINLASSKAKGLDFSTNPDTHQAYRVYISIQWDKMDKYPPVWTKHGRPVW